MSRRKGTFALAVSSYMLLGLALVEGVLLVPLYLYYVGDALYGAWLATGNIVAVLGLFDFGLNSVIIQKVAEAHGAGDTKRVGRYIASGLCLAGGLSLVPMIVGFAFAGKITRLVPVPPVSVQILSTAFVIGTIATSMMLLMYTLGGILVALQRQLLHGVVQVGSEVVGILGIIGFLLGGYGLLALPLGALIRASLSLAGEGAVFLYLRGPRRSLQLGKVDRSTVAELMKPSAMMFAARGGATVVHQSDSLLIGMIMDARFVVIYTLSKRALDFLIMLVGHLVGAFTPSLAHLFGEIQGRTERARLLTDTLIHMSSVLSFMAVVGYVVFDRAFVNLWVGPSRYAGDWIAVLLGIYGVLFLLSLPMYNIIFARGQILAASVATGAEAVLRVGLVVGFAKWLGLVGVAIGAILSCAVTYFLIPLLTYQRIFKISASELIRSAARLSRSAFGIVAIGAAMWLLPEPKSVVAFGGQVALYLLGVSASILITDSQARELMGNLLRRQMPAFQTPSGG